MGRSEQFGTQSHADARGALWRKLNRGEKPVGIYVSSIDPAVTRIMGDAGYDYVVLDGEHGRFGRLEVETHAYVARAHGVTPLVRVLENSRTLIQSMLDAGAEGLLVPHVDTAEDAARAVAAGRYSPRGTRGMCPACSAGGFTLDGWADRVAAADANVLVIPIIESRLAVENIEAILAVDGVDIVHFGPGDLSADMGLDFVAAREPLNEAWHRCLDATRRAGKRMLAPSGFDYDDADILIAPMELMLLRSWAQEHVRGIRDKLSGRQEITA